MDDKPVDRSLLIPIFLAVFSMAGIVLVLLSLRISTGQADVETTATPTPLRFQFLATEPGVVMPTDAPTTELTPVTASPTAFFLEIEEPTATSEFVTATFIPVGNFSPTPTTTFQPLGRTYDDADFALNYTGNWIGQSGVAGVFQNTLHLSNTIGDSVQLSFVGQKIRFVFQAGPSLGSVAILLDNVDFNLDQSATETQTSEWESPLLVLSSHTITITHISGGSINIDFLTVIDVATSTPTVTVTSTP